MEAIQLSLFSNESELIPAKKQKKAKLGRYERIQRELESNDCDPYKIFIDIESQSLPKSDYTFVDIFCGAGGMTQGLLQAGFRPVASVEINPIASATHTKNFPDCHHLCDDIKNLNPHKLLAEIGSPQVHVVVGGPPCQGFSVAGKRDPNDPRNRLFREFVRVVSEIRPWYVVMENVPGILTIQKGAVKQAICEAFEEIGYPDMSVAVLESAAYGVPQIRPRAIFIANRFGMQNCCPNNTKQLSQQLMIYQSILPSQKSTTNGLVILFSTWKDLLKFHQAVLCMKATPMLSSDSIRENRV